MPIFLQPCKLCGFLTGDKEERNVHINQQHYFPCDQCNYYFRVEEDLRLHLEESHEFDLHHSRETVEANQDISGDFKVLENMPEKQSSMKFRGLAVSFVLSGLESIKDVKKGRNKGS